MPSAAWGHDGGLRSCRPPVVTYTGGDCLPADGVREAGQEDQAVHSRGCLRHETVTVVVDGVVAGEWWMVARVE